MPSKNDKMEFKSQNDQPLIGFKERAMLKDPKASIKRYKAKSIPIAAVPIVGWVIRRAPMVIGMKAFSHPIHSEESVK